MRKKVIEKYTCKDCCFNRMCLERRGICTSFRKKDEGKVLENLLVAVSFIALCIFFACMLYVASEGTLKSLLIGSVGMLPSGGIALFVTNNMVHYDVEE